MMTKKRTSQLANFKLLSVIPVTGMILLSISSNTFPPPPPPPQPPTVNTEDEVPFVVVEEMPSFPGGDAALLKYLGESVNYPAEAVSKNIQGRVIVRFCVTSEGGISQASVLKGVDPLLDAEAIRVVMKLPSFEPGRQAGKAVPVWYMVPITFTLR